jgi:hypothetical protein
VIVVVVIVDDTSAENRNTDGRCKNPDQMSHNAPFLKVPCAKRALSHMRADRSPEKIRAMLHRRSPER